MSEKYDLKQYQNTNASGIKRLNETEILQR